MTKEQQLWHKIQTFEFDKPNIQLTFAKRLAQENNFSEAFSLQVIEEYKKFIFLCAVSESPITPSHFVDCAWHLHLTYTKSYWIDLCRNVLQKDIHHNPTEGGVAEDNKFRNYFQETLRLYEFYFKTKAPKAVWSGGKEKVNQPDSDLDRGKYFVLRKPDFSRLLRSKMSLVVLLSSSCLIAGCSGSATNAMIGIGVFLFLFLVNLGYSNAVEEDSNRGGRKKKSQNNNDWGGCGTHIDTNSSSDSDNHHSSHNHSHDSHTHSCSSHADCGSSCAASCGSSCGGGD